MRFSKAWCGSGPQCSRHVSSSRNCWIKLRFSSDSVFWNNKYLIIKRSLLQSLISHNIFLHSTKTMRLQDKRHTVLCVYCLQPSWITIFTDYYVLSQVLISFNSYIELLLPILKDSTSNDCSEELTRNILGTIFLRYSITFWLLWCLPARIIPPSVELAWRKTNISKLEELLGKI